MEHVFGDNERESDYGYVFKVSGPRTSSRLMRNGRVKSKRT